MAGGAGVSVPVSASVASAATASAANDFETAINFGAGYISTPFSPSQTPATTSEAVSSLEGPATGGQLTTAPSTGGILSNLSSKDATILWVLGGVAVLTLLAGTAYYFTHRSP